MTDQQDLGAIASATIDSNQYMALGTADEAGRPWASPVWYASAEYRDFYWVSSRRRRIRTISQRARRRAS